MTRRRSRIRKALAFGGIALLIAIAVAGFQGWRIVSAIVEAEKSVVVPLPTRNADVALGGAANSGALKPEITPGTAVVSDEQSGAVVPTVDDQIVIPSTATTTPVVNVTVDVTPTSEAGITPTPGASSTVVAGSSASTPVPTIESSPPSPTPPIEQVVPTPTGAVTSTPEALPTIDTDGTGGPETTPEMAPVATPSPQNAATPAPSTYDTASVNGDDDDSGGTSTLDVIQQVLGQGFNAGDPSTSEVWNGKTILNILVIGLDSRAEGGDQNADVIIIAQIDLINRQMRAVSIPRDLLVEIPGFGYDKINSAYNHGIAGDPSNTAAGVGLVRDTVEYNFGVPIDDYVMINFSGFTDVVDAVGGITVDVPYDIYDPEYPTEDYGIEVLDIPAGETEMDGEMALKYVRTRHADSDDQRRERQLQVLRAIFSKGQELGSLSKIDNMILALGDSAQTSFPLDEQLTLARLALEMDDANITLTSLAPPLIYGGTIDTGAWVYSGDMTAIAQFVQDSINGTASTASGG
ncbi:hypothetical protein BH09CHL1_BH09CHL1_21660 [soil metagenome]